MTSLTSQQAAMIEEAFKLQQSSVEFDIHVRGSLKNDYVLEGIMKASKQNSMKYARNAGQVIIHKIFIYCLDICQCLKG
jgi:hypothetical protein